MTQLTRGLFLLAALGLFSGCAEQVKGAELTPSESFVKIRDAAKKGDIEAYKQGLSKNFRLVIDRYMEMGQQREELRGAFDYPKFMQAMVITSPTPKEEIIKGNKAVVRGIDAAGNPMKADMVLEDGTWKLEVPDSMVTGLDHFDEVAAKVGGEEVPPRPDIQVGGGGKADRAKSLPADATPQQRQKATALDTFDLGDLKGAEKLLEEAYKAQPEDEELAVALGRVKVQLNKGTEAVGVLADYLKRHPQSSPARHYVGMAYMFEKRYDLAAANWKKIMQDDPEYGNRFQLDKRAGIAEAIHNQEMADPMAEGGGGGGHGGGGGAPGGGGGHGGGGGGHGGAPAGHGGGAPGQ